jgi:histidine triad (HIT) family protein
MSDDETIFHKIIKKDIPADIVFEDDHCMAIRDINPASPCHILVIPKKSIAKLSDVKGEDKQLLGHMLSTLSDIARDEGINESGFRVVINNGAGAGQTVFQLHMHLLGGRELHWPPG